MTHRGFRVFVVFAVIFSMLFMITSVSGSNDLFEVTSVSASYHPLGIKVSIMPIFLNRTEDHLNVWVLSSYNLNYNFNRILYRVRTGFVISKSVFWDLRKNIRVVLCAYFHNDKYKKSI